MEQQRETSFGSGEIGECGAQGSQIWEFSWKQSWAGAGMEKGSQVLFVPEGILPQS